jgi:hypothetical protein
MYLRLRLLRPILLQQVSKQNPAGRPAGPAETPTTQVGKSICERICQLCVTTAHEVLEELHLALSGKQRTSPWHALFCKGLINHSAAMHQRLRLSIVIESLLIVVIDTFAAASALVAATLCPDLGSQMYDESGKTSWTRAIEIFQFHSSRISSAEKGIEALHWFRRMIAARTVATNS